MFKASLKKELLETFRTKKFYMILAIAMGMAIFSVFMLVIMEVLQGAMPPDMVDMSAMFENTYGNSVGYFSAFMNTYFIIVVIILFCGSISQEIEEKKWILPMNSGINPMVLIATRIIFSVLIVATAFILSAILHLIITVLVSTSDGFSVLKMLEVYGYMLINLTFVTVLIVTINAITKKRWIPVVITLFTILVLPNILGVITISRYSLTSFTVFEFQLITGYLMADIPFGYTLIQWLSMTLSTIAIVGGLVTWALFSTKIKAENIRTKPKFKFFNFKKAKDIKE